MNYECCKVLINIPVKFEDSRFKGCWVGSASKLENNLCKISILQVIKGDNPTIGGAQQLILYNIPIKFEDSRSYGFWVRLATKFVIIYLKFNISGAIIKKISKGDNQKIESAQLLMLSNIPVKFEDSRSKGCWVKRVTKLVIIYVKFQYFRGNNSKVIKGR